MSKNQQQSVLVAASAGTVNEAWELWDVSAMMEACGVRKGDRVIVKLANAFEDGEQTFETTVEAVMDADRLLLAPAEHLTSTPYNVTFEILRSVKEPCVVCGHELSDHRHCWTCTRTLDKDHSKLNCEDCLDVMRKKLAQLGENENGMAAPYMAKVKVPGTRGEAMIRTRTVEEGDRVTEEQERMVMEGLSPDVMQARVRMMVMGYAVVEDLNGERLEDKLPPMRDEKTGAVIEGMKDDTPITRMRHFLGMRRARYDSLERAVQRFDMLVTEACQTPIVDNTTEEELLFIADHLATQDEPYVGVVHALDGGLPLVFNESRAEDQLEVSEVLNEWHRLNDRKVTEFRYDQMKAVVNLASFFRADNRVDFGEESLLKERLMYILSLPLDLYYHYAAAASVFDNRLKKAQDLLKNF